MNRWLRQAHADLQAARDSSAAEHYEWACFQAQQAAEKAIKAFLYSRGRTSILSHSLTELVQEACALESSFGSAASNAHRLDAYYIPTRYPNGLAGEITPSEFYTKEDAQQCLASAESILTVASRYTKSS